MTSRFCSLLASISALCVLSSCGGKDDRLFDETGVWSVSHHNLGGTLVPVNPDNAQDALMLRFDPDRGVVAAAACAGLSGSYTPTGTNCRYGNGEPSSWECHCLKYSFSGSTMTMSYLDADGNQVSAEDTEGGGPNMVAVSKYPDSANTYLFQSLPGPVSVDPDGLFGSDGQESIHGLQKIYNATFDESPCAEYCFGG